MRFLMMLIIKFVLLASCWVFVYLKGCCLNFMLGKNRLAKTQVKTLLFVKMHFVPQLIQLLKILVPRSHRSKKQGKAPPLRHERNTRASAGKDVLYFALD